MGKLRTLGTLYTPPGSKLAMGVVTQAIVKTLNQFEPGRVGRRTGTRDVIIL